MLKKRYFLLALLLLTSFSLSGCWSQDEPKNLAMANSVIYDWLGDGQYQITLEFMNPHGTGGTSPAGSGSSGAGRPNITVTSQGPSYREAIANAAQSIDKAIFGGHNEVRFFTERMARNDVILILDYLARDYLTDLTPYIVIIQGDVDPGTFYSTTSALSETAGNYINNLKSHEPEETSKAVFVTTLDFIKQVYADGKQPVAGVVKVVESEPNPSGTSGSQSSGGGQGNTQKQYKLVYEGLAAFKDNALVGYMDGIGARAYNIVTQNIKSAVVSVPTGQATTVFQIRGSGAQNKIVLNGNQVTINLEVKIIANILSEDGQIDITKPDGIKMVQQSLNEMIAREIVAAIGQAQTQFQSDIFGFGTSMHIQYPQLWKTMEQNWDDYFTNATVNVSVTSTIDRTGKIKEPFKLEETK